MFQSWFFDHFLPLAPCTRPLLLLMENHLSHFNPAVIKKAAESGVVLTCIPPNTTHLVQPLDRCAFASFKRQWAIQCHHFTVRQGERLFTQANFSKIFQGRGVPAWLLTTWLPASRELVYSLFIVIRKPSMLEAHEGLLELKYFRSPFQRVEGGSSYE